ncbi:MAG: hypothetical protein J1F35_01900 [Erysipelotrichales bacterium]|nr:hypothetical protein [Erysipelotrichales bacterium]
MNENISRLKENILSGTKNVNKIMKGLESINGNTIIVGTGGSRVVAEFASSVLSKKNNIITKVVDSRDLRYMDLTNYKNIFIVSYSGSNFGVKSCFDNDLKKYLLTHRKSKIDSEELLNYEMASEKSFISISSSFVPMAILLKYYYEDKFDILIEDIFNRVNKDQYLNIYGEYVNIYSGIDTRASASFLETTFAESGLSVPLIHEKYSYCHGRSTINKSHVASAIYLGFNGSDLDIAIKDVLDIQMKEYLMLENIYDDSIINDFYLSLNCLYLLKNIAEAKKINLSDIKYDKDAVRKLYYFKGSM